MIRPGIFVGKLFTKVISRRHLQAKSKNTLLFFDELLRIDQEFILSNTFTIILGRVAQSVTCLATDACLTADPGVASSIPVRSHTFVEIDHEIISTVILVPSADLFKKGCCQLQAKVCARITG